jgi:hypothetical protein
MAAAGDWYVYDETNSAGEYTKVWVGQGAGTSNETQAGPFATEAAAKAWAQGEQGTYSITGWAGDFAILSALKQQGTGPLNTALDGLVPSWDVLVSGISGWFVRGLKVVFGGILLIMSVSHLTGASNKLTQVAGSALPVLAA